MSNEGLLKLDNENCKCLIRINHDIERGEK